MVEKYEEKYDIAEIKLWGETVGAVSWLKEKSYAVMGFKIHLLTFLVISAGLLVLNLVISPSVIWAMYPFIMWGAVVTLHGLLLRFAPEFAVAPTITMGIFLGEEPEEKRNG